MPEQEQDTNVEYVKSKPENVYSKAFDMFMNDPRRLSPSQIARELNLNPENLTKHAQVKGWEQLRINQSNIVTVAQNERRLNIAKRVDDLIVQSGQQIAENSTKQYLELFQAIGALPIDPKEVPDDELPKDDKGNVKSYPKRSKLIEDKLSLLNLAVDGYMKLAQGSQNLGLVLATKMTNTETNEQNAKNLSNLNQLLVNIQINKPKKDVINVTDVKGNDGK